MKKLRLSFLIAAAILIPTGANAQSVVYKNCISAQQSAECLIAFEKLKTLINPITKEKFFHDGQHVLSDGSTHVFPILEVASPDIDEDGIPELIVRIPDYIEEVEGQFCLPQDQCPHYIIQDRTIAGEKTTVNSYKAIGPIFAYSVALSTDEVVDNFKSLRVYYDGTWQNFDAYQYDVSTDSYFNMGTQP